MEKSAVFFGGLLLGVVLSAACGLDLFPSGNLEPAAARKLKGELEIVRGELEVVRIGSRLHKTRLEQRDKEIGRLTSELRSAAKRSGEDLDSARDDWMDERGRLEAELFDLRDREAAAVAQAGVDQRRFEQVLASEYERLLRVLARPSGEPDATRVTEYLASDASEARKRSLLLFLKEHRADVLLSLPTPGDDPWKAREAATTAPSDVWRPLPAVTPKKGGLQTPPSPARGGARKP